MLHWKPWQHKRTRQRPQIKWTDNFKEHARKERTQTARNKEKWREKGDDLFIRKWIFEAV